MTLKTHDSPFFNLSMVLNINYDLKYIEITVNLKDKKKHTTHTHAFPAADFSAALQTYDILKKYYI